MIEFMKRSYTKYREYALGPLTIEAESGVFDAQIELFHRQFEIGIPSALSMLDQYGKAGNDHAYFLLARLYTLGEFLDKNYELALEYYVKSASNGSYMYAYELSLMYLDGVIVGINAEKAKYWRERYAVAGDVKAQLYVGRAYIELYDDDLTPHDPALAEFWLKKAASAGFAEAQSVLGMMYYFGDLGKKEDGEHDYDQAEFWLKQSANREYLPGIEGLTGFYLSEFTDKRNEKKALSLINRSLRLGSKEALAYLAEIAMSGKHDDIDREKASYWIDLAISAGIDDMEYYQDDLSRI